MTMAPACGIMVCQYLCIIYPAFVAPWFPRSVYALKCSVYWCAHMRYLQLHSNEQQRWLELLVSAMKIIDKEDRYVNMQRHGIHGFSLLRHWKWSCSCLSTCQHACKLVHVCVTQKWPLRAIQTNSAETSLACWLCSHCHNGSPLVFLECTSYRTTCVFVCMILKVCPH